MTDSDRGVVGGRYQVIASLGKGGMGHVYKAYDPILDRTVALKKMIATVVDSEEGRQRFYIEARAAARLNHPNIVTIHELEEYGGDIYIVMELLDGVSLAAFMRQRPRMPLSGYLTIITQIAEGLHYAHKRGIVHRDVKPPNLVLTTSGNVKVLDFGIARLASNDITKTGKLLGTPHYMAPEQVTEEAVDPRTDLFSLGAVAYELVTGVKPFAADSVPALLMQITSTPHRPVLDVAPETEPALAAIIDRLLAKDRTQRFGTGMELVAALDLIGEIDRIDYVAEAVAAVMGPSGEATIYAPIGSTPQPGASTPTLAPSFPASPADPPLFGVTAPGPVSATPVSATPPIGAPPLFGPPTAVDATLSLSAPVPSSSADATTQIDVEALPKPDAPPRSVTLDTMIGAPPPLPDTAVARPPAPAAPASTFFAPVPPPPVRLPSTAAAAKTPTASTPPPEIKDTLAAVPPIPAGAAATSSVTPHPDKAAAPATPPAAMPSHAASPSSVPPPPSAAARAAGPPSIPVATPATPAATTAAAAAAAASAASADVKTPAPRGFVNAGVPQARHRSGSGAAVVVIGLLLLPAVVATGWWALNSVRGAMQRGTTTASVTDTTSPSSSTAKDADPSAQKPAEQPADQRAAANAQANPANQASQANQADPNQAKPGQTPAETPTARQQQPPPAPAVEANAAAPTGKPPESQPPSRPADATRTANATQTSEPTPAPATNQANASQLADSRRTAPTTLANQPTAGQLADARRTAQPNATPGANQANANPDDANRANNAPRDVQARNGEPARDAVTDRTREISPNTVVRDATRENTRRPAADTPREPQPPQRDAVADNARSEPAPPVREETPAAAPSSREPSTPADTRSLDYGSLGAFRGGSRSTESAGNVYSDSPSAAAAVARITYALEAYGDAIAARDLDALRDVRSPVTPAEATMLKDGRLTVRFTNLDVSLDGSDARVRCRRAVVANGKTLSSGPADVRLTRRPEGWIITDIR